MGYNIANDNELLSTPIKTSISGWVDNYKQAFLEHSHDQSMLSLVTPDDSLIVVGPPRLSFGSDFYVVGFVNSMQYTESSAVQPLKAIGSRRHIFSRTNAPVQGTIARLMVLGANLYRALYAMTEVSEAISDRNSQYAVGDSGESSSWFVNLEEDLFRIPFGLGIIYNAPATLAAGTAESAGAEYLEVVTLVNRSVASQSGQSMIMEQVSFMADRVVPWHAYKGPDFSPDTYINTVGELIG